MGNIIDMVAYETAAYSMDHDMLARWLSSIWVGGCQMTATANKQGCRHSEKRRKERTQQPALQQQQQD